MICETHVFLFANDCVVVYGVCFLLCVFVCACVYACRNVLRVLCLNCCVMLSGLAFSVLFVCFCVAV